MVSVCSHSFVLGSNEIDRGMAREDELAESMRLIVNAGDHWKPNQNSNVNDPNQNKQITKRSSSFEVNKCFVTTTKEQKTKKKKLKI